MGQNVCWGVLLSLALTVPCLSQQDEMFSIVVDMNKDSISVEIGGMDICKAFVCPQGSKCEVQTAPALLKIPVPRCVPDKVTPATANGMCKNVAVATNILQCKTRDEWSAIGNTQCKLNQLQGQPTKLVNARAWHVCPILSFPLATRYLSASFNCCRAGHESDGLTTAPQTATPTRGTPTSAQTTTPLSRVVHEPITSERSKGFQLVKDKISDIGQQAAKFTGLDSTESTEQTSNVFYLLLLVLGLSFLLSFLLISLLVSLRLKQRRRHRQQKQGAATSMVNPAADRDFDRANAIQHSNDKSSLVDNMQITY